MRSALVFIGIPLRHEWRRFHDRRVLDQIGGSEGAMRLVGAAQDLSAASPRRQSLEGGMGLREPETHLHLGEERNGGSEVLGTVGTTEQAG